MPSPKRLRRPGRGTTYNGRLPGFTPFRPPTRPPQGYYDPAIDAGVRAAGRGLGDLSQDTERDNARGLTDYVTGQNRIDYNTGNSLADLLRGSQRENADYGTASGNLDRSYVNLRSSQQQNANAAGVLDSGWAAAARAKRDANQARDQSVLDTSHGRAVEDYGTNVTRTNNAADMQRGDLTLGYQRGGEDRQTNLTRATRENELFGADSNEAAWYGARAAGYVPPTKPANEHTVGNVTYRDLGHGQTVSADGTRRTRAQLRRLLARRGLLNG